MFQALYLELRRQFQGARHHLVPQNPQEGCHVLNHNYNNTRLMGVNASSKGGMGAPRKTTHQWSGRASEAYRSVLNPKAR